MISDCLQRYYDVRGSDDKYNALRSFTINDHEIAWMRVYGKVKYTDGREGDPYTYCGLYCECDFIEGVGWKMEDDQIIESNPIHNCLYKETVCHMRRLELRREYEKRFFNGDNNPVSLKQKIPDIILDLLKKTRAEEFIGEIGNGPMCHWGGYLYLQTVEGIIASSARNLWGDTRLWKEVNKMVEEKKIGINCAVIYRDLEHTI